MFSFGAIHRLEGGTDEVLRNILAERALGLPAEMRADRGAVQGRADRAVPRLKHPMNTTAVAAATVAAADAAAIDAREFRNALGSFATGVTIVTTRDAAGHDVGLTANSFNSVSLDPPLVLWSLARSSNSLAAFVDAKHFAVHILAADQEPLSNRFATRGADKFAGLQMERGEGGTPLLHGCAARFECRTAYRYAGGDHEIFVGEVLTFEHFDRPLLVYQKGGYALAVKKPQPRRAEPRRKASPKAASARTS